MDFSQLSDFEINKRVAKSIYSVSFVEPLSRTVSVSGGKRLFDPCNNPADAWPIIVDNDISLNSYGSAWEASFEHDAPIGAYGTDETVTSGYEHRNPLRAAMIAFLMKLEHANA